MLYVDSAAFVTIPGSSPVPWTSLGGAWRWGGQQTAIGLFCEDEVVPTPPRRAMV